VSSVCRLNPSFTNGKAGPRIEDFRGIALYCIDILDQ
jgi:hypothetical protein